MPDAEARDYLTSLPGIGPKTAAVVLSFALGRDAIPVDTHVHRITRRLGMVPPTASAERADRLLHELVPDGLRTPMHVGFIRLGREICKAPTPRCRACPLRDLCPTAPSYLCEVAPSTAPSTTRRRLTAAPVRERVRGIEPPSRAWEACVLPLNHTRVGRPDGSGGAQSSEPSVDGRARFRRRHRPASVERHDRAVS